ncbi:hypothetical protein SCACP_28760 [Sporomusa carbonis]|uniref:aspartyl-phosphate phosphatase Spo0E family protein n=1 Tax=Sporomusa carbonis TaxID=3076075 RepID=UPI003A78AB06
MSEIIETLNTIEYLREQMHLLVAANGLSDPRVLEASKMLDNEITKYYYLRRRMNCSNIKYHCLRHTGSSLKHII